MNTLEKRAWFNEGKKMKASHMIVVYDSLNAIDYPIFVDDPDKVKDAIVDVSRAPMQRLLEVYDLDGDRDVQLAEVRTWRLPNDSSTGKISTGD